MTSNVHAIVPVKSLQHCKSRLHPTLSNLERRHLGAAMLRDVLDALANARHIGSATIVTQDKDAQAIVRSFGFHVLDGVPETGPTNAISIAADVCRGASGILALMADLPLITGADIDQILSNTESGPAVTLIPSHDDRGTNAAYWSPPDRLRFVFNGRGLKQNQQKAVAAGIKPKIIKLPRVALDLDRSEDIELVLDQPGLSISKDFLRPIQNSILNHAQQEIRSKL